MSPLSGKTALVTGASRGIGRASALALAHAGAQVLVHYCHEDQAANEVVAQIRSAGGRAGARGNRGGREAAPVMQTLMRIARPEDIGGTVVFLASDDARWITGETLYVDGRSKF